MLKAVYFLPWHTFPIDCNLSIWRASPQNGLTPFLSIWDIINLKYKENNKKICNTFDHNFKNIPLYIMRKVSLERYYFVLYDGALTLKMSKMALNSFCDETLHILPGARQNDVLNVCIILLGTPRSARGMRLKSWHLLQPNINLSLICFIVEISYQSLN